MEVLAAYSTGQLVLDLGDVGDGAIVGFARRFGADIGGGDDMNLVAQAIEGEQTIVKSEDAVGQVYVFFGALGQALKLSHHVVGKISDAARSEGRQPRDLRGTVLAQMSP